MSWAGKKKEKNKYNELNKDTVTVNAMMEDGLLKEQSGYSKYIFMSLAAIIIMLITYRIIHRK